MIRLPRSLVYSCLILFTVFTTHVSPGAARAEEDIPLQKQLQVAMGQGSAWLVKQQSNDDQGWHSQTHGSLKDGAAVTTLAVYALAKLPAHQRTSHLPAIEKAFEFLAAGQKRHNGPIAAPDGSFDYPTYATALWLTARRELELKPTPADEAALAWLLAAQLTEERGFAEKDQAYGGWDLLGSADAQGVTTGSNVSVTLFVLEALQFSDSTAAQSARTKAQIWLARCQSAASEGGFSFTPEAGEHQHKAGSDSFDPPHWISYGTATADGLRSMLLADTRPDAKSNVAAIAWLQKHRALDAVPGFEHLSPEIGWQRSLRFYYAQSLAAALPHFSEPLRSEQRTALIRLLLAAQQPDGSWKNESARMREDDPLIATSLALIALARLSAN